MKRSEVIVQVAAILFGVLLGAGIAAGMLYLVARDIRHVTEHPGSPPTRNPAYVREHGLDLWTIFGPALLLVGMGGTAFVEQKLHRALIHNGQPRWDFGRKELHGIIAGCPFFAFIMAGAMFLPLFFRLDRYNILSIIPTFGWTIAAGGLINGLLLPWVLLRITRWTQPNVLRYGAVSAIWLNTVSMICHAYFVFVNPDALHRFVGPTAAMASLWVLGLGSLVLLFLTAGEGTAGMQRLFRIDWGAVWQWLTTAFWIAAALIGLAVNVMILPAWQFRSRILRMPWRLEYVFTYGPPVLLVMSVLLWYGGRRATPPNRLLALLAIVLLLAGAGQFLAFPRVGL